MNKEFRIYVSKEEYVDFVEVEEAREYKQENNIAAKIEAWEHDGEWEFIDYIE